MRSTGLKQAESSCLACMASEKACWASAKNSSISGDSFSGYFEKQVFKAIDSIYTNPSLDCESIDFALMVDVLVRLGLGEIEISEIKNYVISMFGDFTTTAHIDQYIKIIKDFENLRAIESHYSTLGKLLKGAKCPEKAVESYKKKLSSLTPFTSEANEFVFSLKDSIADIAKNAALGVDDTPQIKSFIHAIDSAIVGFGPGELVVLAARPGVGKTSFALSAGIKNSFNNKKVGYFTIEMSATELSKRAMSQLTDTNLTDFRTGKSNVLTTAKETQKVIDNSSFGGFEIIHKPSLSRHDVVSFAYTAKEKMGGLDFLVVDYLQLMELDLKLDNQNNALGKVTKRLKQLAGELAVPVLLLSQMNRAIEGREDKMPKLSDLRDSGSIEQDADMVMFLCQSSREDEDYRLCNIAKFRSGAISNNIKLGWDGKHTRFNDYVDQDNLSVGSIPIAEHSKEWGDELPFYQ